MQEKLLILYAVSRTWIMDANDIFLILMHEFLRNTSLNFKILQKGYKKTFKSLFFENSREAILALAFRLQTLHCRQIICYPLPEELGSN